MGYAAKVGGYQWRQTLADIRRENGEVLRLLEKLARAARSAETRAAVLEGQVGCYRIAQKLDELRTMEDRH